MLTRSASVATAALKKDMDNKVIQGGKFDDKSTNAEREEHLVRQADVTKHVLIYASLSELFLKLTWKKKTSRATTLMLI